MQKNQNVFNVLVFLKSVVFIYNLILAISSKLMETFDGTCLGVIISRMHELNSQFCEFCDF